MLYIASALTPTSILGSIPVPSLTSLGSQSVVIAKPDRVEVWDIDKTGPVQRASLELWGSLVTIEKVAIEGARPHFLVLLAPPDAHLLLVAYNPLPTPALVVTSTLQLTPPTPSLRRAEFFSSVISQGKVALVSLWIGVLSCVEIEIEKDKDAKRRRSSAAVDAAGQEGEKKLVFKDNFNINIREHNLLNLAFLPNPTPAGPMITFLWLSSTTSLQLQTRILSISSHAFTDATRALDVVSPLHAAPVDPNTDFNEIPFSVPAARRVLPIATDASGARDRMFLVFGDEHTVLYSVSSIAMSPKATRTSGTSLAATSPRASAARRSPQTEMVGSQGKRRKSSMTARRSSGDSGDRWEMRPIWRVRQGFGTILAASVLQSHSRGASVLFGDECGRLIALGWDFDKFDGILDNPVGQNGAVRVRKLDMGMVSPPSSLAVLTSSHVLATSACGDSLIVRLVLPASGKPLSPSLSSVKTSPILIPGRKGKMRAKEEEDESSWAMQLDEDSGKVEILERWMNLAPVKDFCVVEEEGGSLSHLVIASGASTTNSLRVVRSGVGLEENISVDGIEGIERLWALSPAGDPPTLIVSTSSTTCVLNVEPDVAVAPLCGQIASRPTLAAALLPNSTNLATVCEAGVEIWSDIVNGERIGSWMSCEGREIVAAQISGGVVVLARRGGEVVVLATKTAQLEHVASCNVSGEISALSVIATPALPSPMIAIATWSSEVLLYTLDSLASSSSAYGISEPHFASSLLLKPSNSSNTSTSGVQLLIGLSDGGLVAYDLEPADDVGGVAIKGRKASSLGSQPLQLCTIENWRGAEEDIVAIGLSERMSVIFEARDRIDFSATSRKDVVAATAISAPSGSSLVLATPTGLTFSKVNSLKKLHVQTLDLKEKSVNRLAVFPELRVLAAGAVTRSMDAQTGEVLQRGSFELRDATSLKVLAEMPLGPREEITCINSVVLLANRYIAIGLAVFSSDSDFDDAIVDDQLRVTARDGRLLLVKPEYDNGSKSWLIKVVTSLKTVGPVHDAKLLHGFLAIAAASKVSINRFVAFPPSLSEVSSFASTFIAQHLLVTPASKHHPEERLVIGDGMRSVFVLDVDPGSGAVWGDQRDMATHSVMGMERVGDGGEGVVVADGYSNLLTFRFKDQIETAASFGLHEDVVRFRPGSLAPASSALDVIAPDLLFATTDGRLGMIGELTGAAAQTMDDLQRNMDRYHKGPGGIGWKSWRKGGTELIKRDTAGFIDGDFVRRFLDADLLPLCETEKILTGASVHEQVSRRGQDGGKVAAERADVARVLEAAAGLH